MPKIGDNHHFELLPILSIPPFPAYSGVAVLQLSCREGRGGMGRCGSRDLEFSRVPSQFLPSLPRPDLLEGIFEADSGLGEAL